MSEEVLIPRMKKIDRKNKKIKVPLLNIIFIFFCLCLIIASAFINIDLHHYVLPKAVFSRNNLTSDDFIVSFCIVPQIPVLMFVCSMLGKRMAAATAFLYIIAGLTIFPLFAMGGGIQYISEYSFGYILAYIPAVLVAGQFLKNKYSYLNIFMAALSGVLIIHCFGIIYMIIIALLKQDGGGFISGWLAYQSGLKILYDLVLSFVFILIGRYVNAFVKFILN